MERNVAGENRIGSNDYINPNRNETPMHGYRRETLGAVNALELAMLVLVRNSPGIGIIMIRNTKDLSPDQKVAIESVLGEPLSEQDSISVRRRSPIAQISDARRREILRSLEAHFAQVDAQRQPVSGEEADAIIDEALRST